MLNLFGNLIPDGNYFPNEFALTIVRGLGDPKLLTNNSQFTVVGVLSAKKVPSMTKSRALRLHIFLDLAQFLKTNILCFQ